MWIHNCFLICKLCSADVLFTVFCFYTCIFKLILIYHQHLHKLLSTNLCHSWLRSILVDRCMCKNLFHQSRFHHLDMARSRSHRYLSKKDNFFFNHCFIEYIYNEKHDKKQTPRLPAAFTAEYKAYIFTTLKTLNTIQNNKRPI